MKLSTGRWLENRLAFRASLHLFMWGFHWKLRWPSGVWRHFVVKIAKRSVFGLKRHRTQLWIGWWQSRQGQRKNLNGFRCGFYFDRLPPNPPSTITIPFFPQERKHREVA